MFLEKNKQFFKMELKKCIEPDYCDALFPRTRLVKKNVEDYRNFRQDPIG